MVIDNVCSMGDQSDKANTSFCVTSRSHGHPRHCISDSRLLFCVFTSVSTLEYGLLQGQDPEGQCQANSEDSVMRQGSGELSVVVVSSLGSPGPWGSAVPGLELRACSTAAQVGAT